MLFRTGTCILSFALAYAIQRFLWQIGRRERATLGAHACRPLLSGKISSKFLTEQRPEEPLPSGLRQCLKRRCRLRLYIGDAAQFWNSNLDDCGGFGNRHRCTPIRNGKAFGSAPKGSLVQIRPPSHPLSDARSADGAEL